MRNISDKFVEKIKTHLYIRYFFPQNLALYEIMWKNVVKPDRPQMTIWRMRSACYLTTVRYTYLKFVIVPAFPQQK
jgi:hypothetical protein